MALFGLVMQSAVSELCKVYQELEHEVRVDHVKFPS